MKALITYRLYKPDGNAVYKDGKYATGTVEADWPLRFGYNSFNDPRQELSTGINVEDIVSIDIAEDKTKDVTVIQNYNGGQFHFFTVPFAISKDEAFELQKQLGFDPAAYGFYGFDPTISQTIWKCRGSSD